MYYKTHINIHIHTNTLTRAHTRRERGREGGREEARESGMEGEKKMRDSEREREFVYVFEGLLDRQADRAHAFPKLTLISSSLTSKNIQFWQVTNMLPAYSDSIDLPSESLYCDNLPILSRFHDISSLFNSCVIENKVTDWLVILTP